jgi:hypothetical protein
VTGVALYRLLGWQATPYDPKQEPARADV